MSVGDAIAGTLAMARGAPGWRERLPTGRAGVSASFRALFLAAPSILLLAEVSRRGVMEAGQSMQGLPTGDPIAFAVLNLGVAVTAWMAGLALLARLARRDGGARAEAAVIVGYNWARFIAHTIGGLGAVLAVATSVPAFLSVSSLAVLAASVWLDLGIIRRALELPLGRALGAYAFVLLARVLAGLVVTLLGLALLG